MFICVLTIIVAVCMGESHGNIDERLGSVSSGQTVTTNLPSQNDRASVLVGLGVFLVVVVLLEIAVLGGLRFNIFSGRSASDHQSFAKR